jgi:hypothetical protein
VGVMGGMQKLDRMHIEVVCKGRIWAAWGADWGMDWGRLGHVGQYAEYAKK